MAIIQRQLPRLHHHPLHQPILVLVQDLNMTMKMDQDVEIMQMVPIQIQVNNNNNNNNHLLGHHWLNLNHHMVWEVNQRRKKTYLSEFCFFLDPYSTFSSQSFFPHNGHRFGSGAAGRYFLWNNFEISFSMLFQVQVKFNYGNFYLNF